jgi:hypothetical protein
LSTPQHQTSSRQKENISTTSKYYNNNNNNNKNNSIIQETFIQLKQVSSEKKGIKMHPDESNNKMRRRTITSNKSKRK